MEGRGLTFQKNADPSGDPTPMKENLWKELNFE